MFILLYSSTFLQVMPKRQTIEEMLRRLKFQRIPFKSVEFDDGEEEEQDELSPTGEDARFAA
jgi:hypothetical protein